MQNSHEIRRRSSVVERPAAEDPTASAQTTTMAYNPGHNLPRPCLARPEEDQVESNAMDSDQIAMPPPQTPSEDYAVTRSSRSTSSASRNTNRLSLTLPIALPTSDPSRPASSVTSSYPPTPAETSAITSPVDPSDFIIAIAAQERRVLEIREELARAEGELTRLKRQWTSQEAHKKRSEIRRIEPLRPFGLQLDPTNNEDSGTPRRSADLERRKALLQGQQTTPREYRSRVFRGNHTRTLSLLSPTKTEGGFEVHEDADGLKSPDLAPRASTFISTPLSKRASWQPRSYQTGPNGVKQFAEDFKLGLWSFVEDIRQATVGEEASQGFPVRSNTVTNNGRREKSYAADQETIKASAAARPRLNTAFDPPGTETPTRMPRALQERPNPKPAGSKSKHFSWTPLTFDAFDDNDWSNWDSPATSSTKSARWSGSTIGGDEGIASIPEKNDENQTPLKHKSSLSIDTSGTRRESASTLLSPTKLEELLPQVVNRLSPGNLKRTTSDLLNKWEKSLSPPPQTEGELIDFKENVS